MSIKSNQILLRILNSIRYTGKLTNLAANVSSN